MKNKLIYGLIAITGVVFLSAVLVQNSVEALKLSLQLYQIGVITGISAIMVKLLVTEKKGA